MILEMSRKKQKSKILALMASGLLCLSINSSTNAADINISGWIFHVASDRDSADDIELSTLGNSGNQLTFDTTQDIGNDLTAGVNFRINTFGGSADDALDQRSIRLSGGFGTVDFGQNLTATGFADSYTASPTYWFDPVGIYTIFGATGASGVAGIAPDFVGTTSRNERLRYDSPSFGGFGVKAQYGDNNSHELLLTYSKHGILANVFFVDRGRDTEDTTGFLLAYNAPTGVFGSVTSSSQDVAGGGENKITGGKIGYTFNSKHSVSYSFHVVEDSGTDDYERGSLGYVYKPGGSLQLFAQATSEERGSLSDDAVAVGAGIFF